MRICEKNMIFKQQNSLEDISVHNMLLTAFFFNKHCLSNIIEELQKFHE